jgi:pyruvate/2-oxoglutarate dehydrogenase complex dihydrolipoamide dehydrogenase (E3) component
MAREADVVVVGGGAAGLSAASAARRHGASVILVERSRLGGDCTWTGCVPSKALLEVSRRLHGARQLGLDGAIDFAAAMEGVARTIIAVSEEEDRPTLESQGIAVLEGEASFTGPRTLDVHGTAVTGKHVILATGSTALVPPIDGLDEVGALTNDTVFDLRELPRRLAVLGGGPIGLELGQAFARLGSEVTILEGADRIAGKEEPETSEVLERVLTADGVRFHVGSMVERASRAGDGAVTLRTGDGTEVTADEVLVAVGRKPVTDGLAAERGGVALTDSGHIEVDDKLRTSADGVYAIGDITGGPQFTHAGHDMGALAVDNALGRLSRSWDTRALPWATFTDPEVGRVGMTEAEAHAEHGEAARVAFFPIAETDRAKTSGQADGFVKIVAGPHPVLRGAFGGQVLGATVVCPTGGDVVHELAVAMQTRMIVGRLAQTVHAYPSWSLAVREAAAMFFHEHKGRTARPARQGS